MAPHSNPISLQSLGRNISIALAGLAVAVIAAVGYIYYNSNALLSDWTAYRQSNSSKEIIMREIHKEIGYGGMIHQFKNYVLRGDEKRLSTIQQKAGALHVMLEEFRIDDLTHSSDEHTAAVAAVVLAYLQASEQVRIMSALGASPEEIDQKVKIDDSAALAALDAMTHMAHKESGAVRDVKVAALISDLRKVMGYGGMIHRFKNYVLRGREQDLTKARATVQDTYDLLDKLRQANKNPEVVEAIDQVHGIAAAYATALDTVEAMHATGEGAKSIDAKVKIDDGPALKAFERLQQLLAEQVHAEETEMTSTLQLTMTVVLGGAIVLSLLLAGLMVWTRRVLRGSAIAPADAISKAVSALAKGDTNIDVDAFTADTELGRIAAACTTFRDALKANAELSKKAKEDAEKQKEMAAEQARLLSEQQEAIAAQERSEEELRQRSEERAKLLDDVDAAIEAAGRGDFSYRVSNDLTSPELRSFADNVNHLIGMFETAVQSIETLAQKLAQGDLAQSMQGSFKGSLAKLQDTFDIALNEFRGTIKDVLDGSESISSEVDNISASADSLSKRTERQAGALEQAAAALEQVTTSVKVVASSATDVAQEAKVASASAERGGNIVQEATQAMERIVEASKRISTVTDLIDDISFQTNLLALNAGVEAARAGEAGRGFAVVASEVRALAHRSSEAAKEISELISASEKEVATGADRVREAGQSIVEIGKQIDHITELVTQVAHSSSEQADGLGAINTSVAEIDGMTQQNASMFEETAASTVLLQNRAHDLIRSGQQFHLSGTSSDTGAGSQSRTGVTPPQPERQAASV